ncbi:hypothetical protein KPH14_006252 [Odynerus spinipes]|uniref:Uncharacterized protein n=1 Tax=Odynerus spinipes TaxID=1348599 RepID=A0AAD9VNS1_9HYME|nr:hypothetical protein KPH14_006252 [Odynerus spinipes]
MSVLFLHSVCQGTDSIRVHSANKDEFLRGENTHTVDFVSGKKDNQIHNGERDNVARKQFEVCIRSMFSQPINIPDGFAASI